MIPTVAVNAAFARIAILACERAAVERAGSGEVILLVDVDGTLCHPIRGAGGVNRWRAQVEAGAPVPLASAVSALRFRPAAPVVVVTSRSETLRAATRRWLARQIPALAVAPLVMRRADDARTDSELRADQVNAVRGGARVVLVDDDWAVVAYLRAIGALREGDVTHDPSRWSDVGGTIARVTR